jgi:hypothetical protein
MIFMAFSVQSRGARRRQVVALEPTCKIERKKIKRGGDG